MSVRVNCSCGKKMVLNDRFAGKKVRCPQCEAVVTVPRVEVEEEDAEPVQRAAETEKKTRRRQRVGSKGPPRWLRPVVAAAGLLVLVLLILGLASHFMPMGPRVREATLCEECEVQTIPKETISPTNRTKERLLVLRLDHLTKEYGENGFLIMGGQRYNFPFRQVRYENDRPVRSIFIAVVPLDSKEGEFHCGNGTVISFKVRKTEKLVVLEKL